jgi:hypothetical protein
LNPRPRRQDAIEFTYYLLFLIEVCVKVSKLAHGCPPGVNVMATIFGDLTDFYRKIGNFLKNQLSYYFFWITSCNSSKKRQLFRQLFQRNYFNIHNIDSRQEDDLEGAVVNE